MLYSFDPDEKRSSGLEKPIAIALVDLNRRGHQQSKHFCEICQVRSITVWQCVMFLKSQLQVPQGVSIGAVINNQRFVRNISGTVTAVWQCVMFLKSQMQVPQAVSIGAVINNRNVFAKSFRYASPPCGSVSCS